MLQLECLPNELLLNNMMLLGPVELDKLHLILEDDIYKTILSTLLDLIVKKMITINTENYQVLFELSPTHKITFVAKNLEDIKKMVKRYFLDDIDKSELFKEWIKKQQFF